MVKSSNKEFGGLINPILINPHFMGDYDIWQWDAGPQVLYLTQTQHWVVVIKRRQGPALRFETIEVYDSLNFGRVKEEIKDLCCILYQQKDLIFRLVDMTQENCELTNTFDCGLFALAVLAEWWAHEKGEIHMFDEKYKPFDQKEMRKHVIKCIDNDMLIRFPLIDPDMTESDNEFDDEFDCSCFHDCRCPKRQRTV